VDLTFVCGWVVCFRNSCTRHMPRRCERCGHILMVNFNGTYLSCNRSEQEATALLKRLTGAGSYWGEHFEQFIGKDRSGQNMQERHLGACVMSRHSAPLGRRVARCRPKETRLHDAAVARAVAVAVVAVAAAVAAFAVAAYIAAAADVTCPSNPRLSERQAPLAMRDSKHKTTAPGCLR
jgi:hypothetical protein